jgi:RecQ-mediated genome instability protein 1
MFSCQFSLKISLSFLLFFFQEWLEACYNWVVDERNLNPANHLEQIIQEIEIQLLESDLRDSMIHGTGIPRNFADGNTQSSILNGPPILVQIESITDIGISAYELNKVRETREERLAAGEQEEGEGDIEVEGEGPVPKYPRSMLRFEISDGVTTIKAMEYRSIPELSLEETQLGCKVHSFIRFRGAYHLFCSILCSSC